MHKTNIDIIKITQNMGHVQEGYLKKEIKMN